MTSIRGRVALLSLALTLTLSLAVGPLAMGADRIPRLGYVYPAGGQRGTSFPVTLGGQYLYNADQILVSGGGVTATIVEQERQLTPKEQNDLKEALTKIQEKVKQRQPLTAEERKQAEDIKSKLASFGRKLANPSLGEFTTLQVTVAADAALGPREIRLGTVLGLSNPLAFHVGDLVETSKKPWKNVPKARGSMEPDIDAKPPVKDVTLPATINGQIPPGGSDRYRFSARAGQQLVVMVQARELIPYIADAVPGWFQAAVVLTDATGKEVAYDDDYRFHPDPVLFYRIPAAGPYVLEIRDALYRGREDFVYRITAGELPFVTGVFPLGGRIGTQSTVAATGWNLSFDKLPLDLVGDLFGIHAFPQAGFENVVQFDADVYPEALENEPNDALEAAQAVTLPIVVNGHIGQPGDVDVFKFSGQAGAPIVVEVLARRLDSPVDSVVVVTDAAGNQLAMNDDHEDKGSGLETHHADSYLALTLPSTGSYFVHLGDTQHGGGPAYSYRLRISAPHPGFSLRVTPSSLTVRGGASVPLTVYALRRDGFAGEITLALKDAPHGFTLTGARIPEKEDRVRATLSAPPSEGMEPFRLRVEGRATIGGRVVACEALPADDMMQAFAYRHLVLAQSLEVSVLPGLRGQGFATILSPTPIRIPAGGTVKLQLGVPLAPWIEKAVFELSDPPSGVSIQSVTTTAGGREIVLVSDAAMVKAGVKGNLIVTVSMDRSGAAQKSAPAAAAQRVTLGTLPAIPFEVVQP
jgi:hypothetical protein